MSSRAYASLVTGSAACHSSLDGSSFHPARPCYLTQASCGPSPALASINSFLSTKPSKASPYSSSQACEACSLISSKPGPRPLSLEAVGRQRGSRKRHVGSSHMPRAAAAAAPVCSSSQGESQSSRSREGRRAEANESGSDSEDESGSEQRTAPACMFVGPLETADRSTLEEFYRQAKDSYYSGNPLILDEMFDRVEVHLRWLRSPVVQKYPRCSLQKNTTYADAEDDPSQLAALYGVWASLLALGGALAAGPTLFTADMVWEHSQLEDVVLGIAAMPGPMLTTTWLMLCAISTGLGLTLASSAWSALKGLQGGGLVALRGVCPSCTEEVYAFVKVDGRDKRPRHKTDCHVCGQRLVFHAILRQPDGHATGAPFKAGSPQRSNSSNARSHTYSDSDSDTNTSSTGTARTPPRGDTVSTTTTTSSSRSTGADTSSNSGVSSAPASSPWPREPPHWVYGRVYAVAKPEDLRPSR